MIDPKELLQLFALGNDDPKMGEFVNRVMSQTQSELQVKDANGDPLVRNGIYELDGEKVQVTGTRYGQGNMFDAYYYVEYRKSDFSTGCKLVEGSYPHGIHGGAVYNSNFKPV